MQRLSVRRPNHSNCPSIRCAILSSYRWYLADSGAAGEFPALAIALVLALVAEVRLVELDRPALRSVRTGRLRFPYPYEHEPDRFLRHAYLPAKPHAGHARLTARHRKMTMNHFRSGKLVRAMEV